MRGARGRPQNGSIGWAPCPARKPKAPPMTPPRTRSLTTAAALAGAALLIAGCSSGPLAKLGRGDGGRYFQYLSPDNQVVGEYTTPDAATCQQHLANLKRGNTHGGSEGTRCSSSSAASRLPVSAAARDAGNTDYTFRFASLEQCTRMMSAVARNATVTRDCH